MTTVEPFDIQENEKKASKPDKQTEEIEENISIKKQLLNLFQDFLSTSTAIGPAHIERASCWPIRIMWILAFLTGTGAGSYFFMVSLLSYLQYGTLNQITYGKSYPTYFPAISICNLNPFNGKTSQVYLDNLLNTKNMSDFISITSTDTLQTKYGTTNTIEILDNMLDDLRWWVVTDQSLNQTERRKLGFELDPDMLISCAFNGKKCTASDFSYYRSYKYGNCFTFNSGTTSNGTKVDLLKTSKTGNDYGLQMELLTGDPSDEVRFVYKSGIYITIFNQTFSPVQIGDSSGVFLPTGFDTYLAFGSKFLTKLPAPYSKCIDDFSAPPNDYAKKLYGYMSSSGVSVYTQDFCQNICYQDQLIDKCSCADASLPTLREAVFCNSSRYQCMFDFETMFFASDVDKQCSDACPVKCSQVSYKLELSQAVYPTSYYIDLLKTKSDFTDNLNISSSDGIDFIDQSLVKIVVNYNDLLYEQTTEIPVTTPDALVGVLGGQIGAFIGITFLSLFEIAHMLMDLVRILYLHRQTKKAAETAKNEKKTGF